uniref:Uncharacterized protein n=1 Tax=Biomphalaria glabrata TaxID=6526 RepID=A0A2C9KBV7_BIOGL
MTNSILYGLLVCAFGIARSYGQDVPVSTGVAPDLASICQAIDATTSKAREGITASELEAALDDIRIKADEYLNERNAKVEIQEIVDLLDEITSHFDQGFVLSALLEDPLVQEGRKVSAGLYTLNELSKRLKEADNDTLINTHVAAVRFTAESMRGIVLTAEAIYTYNKAESNNAKSVNKRWEVTGSVSKGPGGTSWSVGVSHKFGRRLVYIKRNWSAGLDIGYGSGGWHGGLSLSYSWG